jgi:hypothetical protein
VLHSHPSENLAAKLPQELFPDSEFSNITESKTLNGPGPTDVANPLNYNDNQNLYQNTILQCSYEERMKIITPLPPQDASGNRLELKLSKTPKIDPPPEFRNSKIHWINTTVCV